MKYNVTRNKKYDFAGQSYADNYPNLHKYPATMLPQIGISILRELNIKGGNLLDPYCGSGSSFASGLECGITEMYGFDLNPLAVLISKVKFTKLSVEELIIAQTILRKQVFEFLKNEKNIHKLNLPQVTNAEFWFSQEVLTNLNILRHFIYQVKTENIKNFLLLPFSETIRECSFTRNNEFKLYKMKSEDLVKFNPDVFGVYFKKLKDVIETYQTIYLPKLKNNIKVNIQYSEFKLSGKMFDVILTSPPYGDSRTTVAYGQFSTLSNEWLGIEYARKIDKILMGGTKAKNLYQSGIIADYISAVSKEDEKRALEISSFYQDLEYSIDSISKNINKQGKVIYVVGNRTVKNIQLPTDQFIAEKFEQNGLKHLITYERLLSSKAMPSRNSPTNKTGKTVNTMLYEYIVVCENP
jgi:16S rRNA G966 N2-methylase RsmD